ncbi:hypothetical protein EH165_08715 [Nakamurella antarctica]|uniref:Glutamine amidotransferase domain-containing protein n=1 Tax=Nakamurella antarctica TaxID=1902245 RepID=A0A3G8ZN26_9ACTN|nr:membrane dipeptidase [Nakamurella antarctica]AZI58207.1 hypothetical protein EH165_08715 [Nakamurella antarctica]
MTDFTEPGPAASPRVPVSLLVVVNSPRSGPGTLLPRLNAAGATTTVSVTADIPDTPDGYDGVILLGGGLLPSEFEKAPWLAAERLLASRCLAQNVPLLGICLGAQLLAEVAGGTVTGRFGVPERGTVLVRQRAEAAEDALLTGVESEFVVLQNHQDQITALPADAVHLAENDNCAVQAFRVGDLAWGVQFHPEAPIGRLAQWDAASLAAEGMDLSALQEQAARDEPRLEAASSRLVNNFVGIAAERASSRKIRVIDGHNDLPWEMREGGIGAERFSTGIPERHTDLARMRAGEMGAQFWSVWVPDGTPEPFAVITEQIARVREVIEHAPNALAFSPSARQVREAISRDEIGCLIGAEGSNVLEGRIENVAELARAGMRYMTLTHNESTMWADSATGQKLHNGLSEKGAMLVAELERQGVLVDLSHTSASTMHDVLDVAKVPVIFSHSSNYALTRHDRNVPDGVLRRLSANGGVQMITFVPQFVSETYRTSGARKRAAGQPYSPAYLADVADHIEHSCDVVGIAHVGLGGDFDGISSTPQGLTDVSSYPALLAELRRRGWSAAELSALASDNILRVLHITDSAFERARNRHPL